MSRGYSRAVLNRSVLALQRLHPFGFRLACCDAAWYCTVYNKMTTTAIHRERSSRVSLRVQVVHWSVTNGVGCTRRNEFQNSGARNRNFTLPLGRSTCAASDAFRHTSVSSPNRSGSGEEHGCRSGFVEGQNARGNTRARRTCASPFILFQPRGLNAQFAISQKGIV